MNGRSKGHAQCDHWCANRVDSKYGTDDEIREDQMSRKARQEKDAAEFQTAQARVEDTGYHGEHHLTSIRELNVL